MDQSQSSGKEHIIEIPDNDPNLEDSSDFEQEQDGFSWVESSGGSESVKFIEKNPKIDTSGFSWVESSGGEHVVGAVDGGAEPDEMYVGRAHHNGDLIPGNVHCKDGKLYVTWGEKFLYTTRLLSKFS